MVYTINTTTNETFNLLSLDGQQSMQIPMEHPRWAAVNRYLSEGKLLSISDRGTWSGCRDPRPTQVAREATANINPKDIQLTKLGELQFSDELFVPIKTGTPIDPFLSNEGGILPGTNIMCVGDPGTGKTSLTVSMLQWIEQADPNRKVLFISAEMNKLEMARYLKRFPGWASIPMLFLSDHLDNSKAVLEGILSQGWDLVLIDSWTEVNDAVKEETGWSRGKVEKWFLQLMDQHNTGNNERNKYTSFLTILQMNKGGSFVGSQRIKHMTSAMMHLKWRGGENSSERYAIFSKNRVGEVNKKLYYTLDGGVQFDEERYKRDLMHDELIKQERERLKGEEDLFDRLFSGNEEPGVEE